MITLKTLKNQINVFGQLKITPSNLSKRYSKTSIKTSTCNALTEVLQSSKNRVLMFRNRNLRFSKTAKEPEMSSLKSTAQQNFATLSKP